MSPLSEFIDELNSLIKDWDLVLNEDKNISPFLMLKTRTKLIESSRLIQSVVGRGFVPESLPDGVRRLRE